MASLSLGLAGLVDRVIGDPSCSKYYIGGFRQLNEECKRYAAVAALAARVPDAVLAELLQDERLAKIAGSVKDSMQEEVGWLSGLPELTWSRMAEVCQGASADHLRSMTIRAAYTAAAYITRNTLAAVQDLPWRLAQGD
eukprot:8910271-Lingulodinium_polyedra.AAC.1